MAALPRAGSLPFVQCEESGSFFFSVALLASSVMESVSSSDRSHLFLFFPIRVSELIDFFEARAPPPRITVTARSFFATPTFPLKDCLPRPLPVVDLLSRRQCF